MALITGLGIVTQSCDRDNENGNDPIDPKPQPEMMTRYFHGDSVIYDVRQTDFGLGRMEKFVAFRTILEQYLKDPSVKGIYLFPKPGQDWAYRSPGTTETGRIATGINNLHKIDPDNIFGGGEEMKFTCVLNSDLDLLHSLGYSASRIIR